MASAFSYRRRFFSWFLEMGASSSALFVVEVLMVSSALLEASVSSAATSEFADFGPAAALLDSSPAGSAGDWGDAASGWPLVCSASIVDLRGLRGE